MILYEIFPNKTLKIREDENTYITENLISSVHIKLPSTFGDYPVKELTAELRFYFPEGNYMAYAVDTQQARPEVPITNDITEKPQTLSVMLFFYKGGNVIGKTNSVDKVILDAPLKGEPLTPRAEADEKIREQRAKIAEQADTITEQAETIGAQSEQITELSGEVTELTTENTRLETLTETQRETIQNMLDNPPQPKLYTPPEPIEPSGETRVVTAPSGYDGLESVTFLGTDYMNVDLQRWLSKTSDGEPFELVFEYPIGNYLGYSQPKLIKTTMMEGVISIGAQAFYECNALLEVDLKNGVRVIENNSFGNCRSLTTLKLPNSLTRVNTNAFLGSQNLTIVTIENGFNTNLNLSSSNRYSVETIVSWLEALADRTGETAYTLTMGTTNLNKLTAEQKAIAINKNWNLA